MSYKQDFANTINIDYSPFSTRCERYGMTYGCNDGCDTFCEGKCKMEDIDAFRKAIKETDRFDNFSIEELNKLYPLLNLKEDLK